MRKNALFWISVFFILSLLFVSCKNKGSGEVVDVLSYYEVLEKIEPTYLIDFTSPRSEDYLLEGWIHSGETDRWAEGLKSRFYFYGVQKGSQNDLEMTINCYPFVFPGSPEQFMEIYLNSQFIKRISLTPSWNNYQIILPGNLLKEKNIIVFKYRYAGETSTKPLEAQRASKLSVAFTRVNFSSAPSLKLKGNILLQKTGSLLNYYEKIPPNAQLKFHFKNKKESRVRGCVKIESQDIKPEAHFFEQSGDYSIDLAKYSGRITKISFIAKIKDTQKENPAVVTSDRVRWSKIILYRSKKGKEEKIFQPGDNELQAVREKLKKCDIIYIVLDAYAAKHSSAYGYHRKTSPMLEELAAQGVLFENMFATAPFTLASTASLFTSTYPFEHEVVNENDKVSFSLMTLAKKLSDYGITTYCISAVPYLSKNFNLVNHFETVEYMFRFDPAYFANEMFPKIYNSSRIDSRKKFIYIHILPPHAPYQPPEKYRLFGYNKLSRMSETDFLKKISYGDLKISDEQLQQIVSLYDANILYADEYIRKIVTYLREQKLFDNIILIVTSDHGEAFMEHDRMLHDTTLYDEMIHVPFVIKFPDNTGMKSVRIATIASLVDMAPTILDMMGLKEEASFRGKSILPSIFSKKKDARSMIYSATWKDYSRCIRDTRRKYIYNPFKNDELYDLSIDPFEKNNIIEKEPFLAGYYLQQLKMIEKGMIRAEKQKVGINKIDPEKLKQLKELGYVQ